MTETRRGGELRAAPGRRIVGPVMRYGAEARVYMPDGRPVTEHFASFAFDQYLRSGGEVRVNLQHDPSITIATNRGGARGNLELRDGPSALQMTATLPPGDGYDRALALVADGSTAQTSVEFRAVQERLLGDRRVVQVATLPGIGIVDRGAYGDAGRVEVRRRGYGIRARVDYGKLYDCECAGPDCSRAVFEPGSFDDLPDEVLAVAGEYKAPLASMRRGSLRLTTDEAGMVIAVDLPDPDENDAARVVLEVADSVGIYARPYVDRRLSESVKDGETRRYSRAWLRAIILAATDKIFGWTEAEVTEPRRAAPVAAGPRIWL